MEIFSDLFYMMHEIFDLTNKPLDYERVFENGYVNEGTQMFGVFLALSICIKLIKIIITIFNKKISNNRVALYFKTTYITWEFIRAIIFYSLIFTVPLGFGYVIFCGYYIVTGLGCFASIELNEEQGGYWGIGTFKSYIEDFFKQYEVYYENNKKRELKYNSLINNQIVK